MIKRAYLNAILRTAFARGCAVLDEQDNAKSIDRVTFEPTAQSPTRSSSLCRPVRKARPMRFFDTADSHLYCRGAVDCTQGMRVRAGGPRLQAP